MRTRNFRAAWPALIPLAFLAVGFVDHIEAKRERAKIHYTAWAIPADLRDRLPPRGGEIRGLMQQRFGGHGRISIDNRLGTKHFLVKVIRVEDARAIPVRHLYVPKGATLLTDGLDAGTYEVRYAGVEDGRVTRIRPFAIEVSKSPEGNIWHGYGFTLYETPDGNLRTESLGRDEF